MKIINVRLVVKENKTEEYENFIAELVSKSREESGNISYNHYKQVDANNVYEIIEHWKDKTSIDQHNRSEHFQNFVMHIQTYLAKELQVMVMEY